MGSIFKNRSVAKIVRLGVAALSTVIVVACGGGGGTAGITLGNSGGTPASKAGISLDLVDAATGARKTTLTTSGPLVARATVRDDAGNLAAGVIVTFTAGPSAVLSPSAGTGLTNSQGVATITLSVIDLATAQAQNGAPETVTAAAAIGKQALTASIIYTVGSPAVSLKLVAPSSGTVNINAYQTTSIQVNVLADGVIYTAQPVIVSFSSACSASGKASFPASVTTSNGLAQVVYTDKGCSATDTVTVSAAGASSIAVQVVVAAPVATSIGFVSAVPSDKAIVIKGSTATGRLEQATLTFVVRDVLGNPLPNKRVNFSVQTTMPVTLNIPWQSSSNLDGTVFTTVNSGTDPTTFRVIATLANNDGTEVVPKISAISDTITVTTGQPVQIAISLSAGTYNIEGWNWDGITTSVGILMADIFGNPVADGTPVVFQTDSGAIGSSDRGGCLTVNGACSVIFRSQNPRYGAGNLPTPAGKRAGLATINMSSTNAIATLSGQLGIFLSGSTGSSAIHLYDQTGTELFGGRAYSISDCSTFDLQLEVDDVNFNPLPAGSIIAAVNASTITIPSIIPSTVPSIGPHDSSGNSTLVVANLAPRQGSVHNILVKPAATCVAGGGASETGKFDITIKTPLGLTSLYQGFSLTYPIAVPTPTPVVCTLPQVRDPATNTCVTPPSPSISVALSSASLSGIPPAASASMTATATVLDSSGVGIVGALVTFTLANANATMSPSTAVTGAGGVTPPITITKAIVGADSLTATATVGAPAVPVTSPPVAFSINP